jgi:hypothetical protein
LAGKRGLPGSLSQIAIRQDDTKIARSLAAAGLSNPFFAV